mmetsp:Transcript_3970/g.12354  ORF Transcript_3970/g.12354 Transcript_3970/m.12354 type:complete len:2212 (+) Transcript_3970:3300-9935(+)
MLCTQMIQANKYVRPHAKRAAAWEVRLNQLQETVDNLLGLQDAWLGLEPIFQAASNAAFGGMTTEAKLFDQIDSTWRTAVLSILESPVVFTLVEIPGMLTSLVEANSKLASIRRGLLSYLHTKREAFSRFYLVSDAELLKLLADAADPQRVQPHLHKCFPGICDLVFESGSESETDLGVVAVLDANLNTLGMTYSNHTTLGCERLDFAYTALKSKRVMPNTPGCHVECWLKDVETMSQSSLGHYIEIAIKLQLSTGASAVSLFSEAHISHEQVLIVTCQVYWTYAVEAALRRATVATAEAEEAGLLRARSTKAVTQSTEVYADPQATLRSLLILEQQHLDETILAVRDQARDITKNRPTRVRSALNAVIILSLHQRDVMCSLVEGRVCDVEDFEWMAQLRYYMRIEPGSDERTQSSRVESSCVYNVLPYAYEYLGGRGLNRLVYTPLTLRCLRAIFCALKAHAGCAVSGPPASGLTSILNGLARALAIHLLSLNCTAFLDCVPISMLLHGASLSGIWMCLESIGCLNLNVMTIVVAQIRESFEASKKKQLQTRRLTRVFVTGFGVGSPQQTSTAEIFRPVSLYEPEPDVLATVILCSQGVNRFESCKFASHITTAITVFDQMLSERENHYRFGLKLVAAAARRTAFELQRHGWYEKNREAESEARLPNRIVAQTLFEIIEPALTFRDQNLFDSVVDAIFGSLKVTESESKESFAVAFRVACQKLNQQPLDSFYNKVLCMHNAILSWSGVALIGDSFSGKTSTWKNLGTTLDLLYSKHLGVRWCGVTSVALLIGSFTLSELYGSFDHSRHEWTDGVFSTYYRDMSKSVRDTIKINHCFLVLDGVMDVSWTEQLHTALDESSALSLGSGELIHCRSRLSIVFESEHLRTAAPNMVGRISVLHFGNSHMKWHVQFETWVQLHFCQSRDPGNTSQSIAPNEEPPTTAFALNEEECRLLEALAQWLLEPCLAFVRQDLWDLPALVADESLVQSLLRLLDGMLRICLRGADPSAGASDVKERRQRRQHIECAFIWSLLWSVGASGPDVSQNRFGIFLREVMSDTLIIRRRYPKLEEMLIARGWSVPEFTGVFSGILQLALPTKAPAHDYEYRPRDNETGAWRLWQESLQSAKYSAPETGDAAICDVLVPTVFTARSELLLDLLMNAGGHPALLYGPPGSGKTVHARAALSRLPRKKYRTAYVCCHSTTSTQALSHHLKNTLVRRRKGVHGPPTNQTAVLFVDDVNLPRARGLGQAQTPVEFVRGLIANGSWHSFPKGESMPTLRHIEDTSIWAAINGRAISRRLSPRLIGHFTLVLTSDPNEATLARMYTVLVESHFAAQSFTSDIGAAASALVAATVWTLREVISELRPTPLRQLCKFDPRDATRCIQGVMRCRADDDFDRNGLARLWVHEVVRTFGDRLCTVEDETWLANQIQSALLRHFKLDLSTLLLEPNDSPRATSNSSAQSALFQLPSTYPRSNTKQSSYETRQLLFGEFHNALEHGVYLEARDMEQLYNALEHKQDDLTSAMEKEGSYRSRSLGRLTLFPLIVAHTSRIARALSLAKGGHALVCGAAGTGRRAVARLAVHVSGCKLRELRPYSHFDCLLSWREDLKSTIRHASIESRVPVCLLLAETHVLSLDCILADICDVMSTGSTPDLFTFDEYIELAEATRIHMRGQKGSKSADMMSHQDLMSHFLEGVRTRLRIILVVSSASRLGLPENDSTLHELPLMTSHFTCIDYFAPWQVDSLTAIADSYLSNELLEINNESSRSSQKNAAVALCCQVHASSGLGMSTSTFLELLGCFAANLERAQSSISRAQARFRRVLEVAHRAKRAISAIGDGIAAGQAALEACSSEAAAYENRLVSKKSASEVRSRRAEVEADAEALLHEEAAARVLAEEFERDITLALPAFGEAYSALEEVTADDLNGLRNLIRPPVAIKPIIEATCLVLGEKPIKMADPSDPTRRVLDYWTATQQRVLTDEPEQLCLRLRAINHDKILIKVISKLRDAYIGPDATHGASFADPELFDGFAGATIARGLCLWVCAISNYEIASRTAQPKREAASSAKSEVKISAGLLASKQQELRNIEDELAELAAQRDAARRRCEELQEIISGDSCRLERARCLLTALHSSGELERWETTSLKFDTKAISFVSDALLSACALTYLPPLDSGTRQKYYSEWVKACQNSNLEVSPEWSNDAEACPVLVLSGEHLFGD